MEKPWARGDRLEFTGTIHLGMTEIGRWVRESRRVIGFSQRQLERASGVDQTIISRLENGRLRTLRLVRLASIVGALRERDPR